MIPCASQHGLMDGVTNVTVTETPLVGSPDGVLVTAIRSQFVDPIRVGRRV